MHSNKNDILVSFDTNEIYFGREAIIHNEAKVT